MSNIEEQVVVDANTIGANTTDTATTTTDTTAVKTLDQNHHDVVSYGPYYDSFNSAKIYLSEDRTMSLKKCWVSSCNLLDISLAILAKSEMLSKSNLARDLELYNGYKSAKVKYTTMTSNVSILSIAKNILDIAKKYESHEFVNATIGKNWRWSSSRKSEEKSFDPYNFSKSELEIALKDVGMVLSVKTLRLYLIESVKRFFPKVKNSEKWDSSQAVYKIGSVEKTSSAFISFANEIFILFNQIVKLSDHLDEYKNIVKNAILSGKKQAVEKREQIQHAKRLEANYNKSVINNKPPQLSELSDKTKLTKSSSKKGVVFAKKEVVLATTTGATTIGATTTGTTTTGATRSVSNSWKSEDKSLIEKLVDSGIVPKTDLAQSAQSVQSVQSEKSTTDESTQGFLVGEIFVPVVNHSANDTTTATTTAEPTTIRIKKSSKKKNQKSNVNDDLNINAGEWIPVKTKRSANVRVNTKKN